MKYVMVLFFLLPGCIHSGSMDASTSTGTYTSNSRVRPLSLSDSFEERKLGHMQQCMNAAGTEVARDLCEAKVLHRLIRMCRYMDGTVKPCPGQPVQ